MRRSAGRTSVKTPAEPLVSILTPVFNGEPFLTECIESVLAQTYKKFEYIIVNNCSKDSSLETARKYASRDPRIRVHDNQRFVGVIENHNIAFGLMSPTAKYCKVVSADDFVFPECIRRMADLAERHPSVGIVGSYQLSGSVIRWQGFQYGREVVPGSEMCRRVFLGRERTFGFGSPTSLMYRADLVRSGAAFYPNSSAEADTSACFKYLKESDFGFVHQVLSYERTHPDTQSTRSAQLNRYASSYLRDLIEYGPSYLTKAELGRRVKEQLHDYHRFLAGNLLRRRGREFWEYHRARLHELGYGIRPWMLLKAGTIRGGRELLNPGHAVSTLWRKAGPSMTPAAH
jgi:glycosyltransferase involved in cell wall biosynthesis